MDFELTEPQKMLRKTVQDFTAKEIAPIAGSPRFLLTYYLPLTTSSQFLNGNFIPALLAGVKFPMPSCGLKKL